MNNHNLTYGVQIPHNIDLDELLLKYPVDDIPNAKEYLLYILSIIKNDFSPLNSTILQRVVQNYKGLLDWLTERSIIESNGVYKKGSSSYKYRFTSQYRTSVKKEFIYKITLVRKLYKINNQFNRTQNFTIDDIKYNWYGYEPVWLKSTHVAYLLNLKRNKMLKGLRHFNFIKPCDPFIFKKSDFREKTHYDFVIKNNRVWPVLFFNEDFIEEIRILAIENPDYFPSKS